MTEQPHNHWIDPELEARLVALVHGEVAESEREQLQRLVAERPELAALKKELEAVHGLLEDVARNQLVEVEPKGEDDDWKLSAQRRSAVLEVIGGEGMGEATEERSTLSIVGEPAGKRELARFCWNLSKLAAVLCVVGGIGITAFMLLFDSSHYAQQGSLIVKATPESDFSKESTTLPSPYYLSDDTRYLDGKAQIRLPQVAAPAVTAPDYAKDSQTALAGIRGSLDYSASAPPQKRNKQKPMPGESDWYFSGGLERSTNGHRFADFDTDGVPQNVSKPNGSRTVRSALPSSGPVEERINLNTSGAAGAIPQGSAFPDFTVDLDAPFRQGSFGYSSPSASPAPTQIDSLSVIPPELDGQMGLQSGQQQGQQGQSQQGVASENEEYGLGEQIKLGDQLALGKEWSDFGLEMPGANKEGKSTDRQYWDFGGIAREGRWSRREYPMSLDAADPTSVDGADESIKSKAESSRLAVDFENGNGVLLRGRSAGESKKMRGLGANGRGGGLGGGGGGGFDGNSDAGLPSNAPTDKNRPWGQELAQNNEKHADLRRNFHQRWSGVEGKPSIEARDAGQTEAKAPAPQRKLKLPAFDIVETEQTISVPTGETVIIGGVKRKITDRSAARTITLPIKQALPASLREKVAQDEPFSTFSLNVSDVSFKLARAALAGGQWPETAKVRIEEFVNAFNYHDPLPSKSEKVACALEQAIHPFLQQRNLLRVSLRTAATGRSSSTPLRLTFLLDNSGSMERTDRRQTVRRAFALLAQQLTPADQVTLLSFARQPRLLADRVSGARSQQLVELVQNLPSEGGTNLEAALRLAFEKAKEQQIEGAQNRIILLTDGAVNLGDADPQSLSQLVTSMRSAGIAFDAAGISAEGLNDEVLTALTRNGDGRYYLLDRPEAADDGFVRQIAGALRPAAKNVKIQIEFNPRRVQRYQLLGFEKHRLQKEDFRNDQVDAAEMAAAEAGVALYQLEAKPDGEGDVGQVSVRFRDLSTGQMVEHRWPIPYEANAPRTDQATPSLRIATSAALLAAKLQGGPLGEMVDLKTLSQLVSGLPEQYRNAKRVQQLGQMLQQTRQLRGK